jgi:hypothetical protein
MTLFNQYSSFTRIKTKILCVKAAVLSAEHACGLDVRVCGPSTVTGYVHYDRGSTPSTCSDSPFRGVCTGSRFFQPPIRLASC